MSLLSHYALDASDRLGLDLGRLQYDMQSPEIAARIRQELADAYQRGEIRRVSLEMEAELLERDIAGVDNIAGLNEEMRSSRLLAGAEKVFLTVDRTVTLDLAAVWGLSGTQEVSSPGIIDEVELPEGRTYGVRSIVSIPLNPNSKGGSIWTLTPTVETCIATAARTVSGPRMVSSAEPWLSRRRAAGLPGWA